MKFKPIYSTRVWEFKDPNTGFLYEAPNEKALTLLITQYRHNNGLAPIEELPIVIENYLCNHPANFGLCQRRYMGRGFKAIIKGGVALLKNLVFKEIATQEVADLRSEICTSCPHNIFVDKGAFVEWSDKIAEESVGKRRSVNHDKLGNCEICTCPLRAKVWYDGKLDLDKKTLDRLPGFCWQLEKHRNEKR